MSIAPRFRRYFWLVMCRWFRAGGPLFSCLILLTACSGPRTVERYPHRPFVFGQDTFCYSNALLWHYEFDPVTDKTSHSPEKPRPDYTHHCFVVARSARQFFDNARFDPSAPVASEQEYRAAIRAIVRVNPRHALPEPLIIPGYSNLFTFSHAWEHLLKQECGPAAQSYFQRGHWRMILGFSETHQEKMAAQLKDRVHAGLLPLVHVVRFPSLTINHALLFYGCREVRDGAEFNVYDPNSASEPLLIKFDRNTRRFSMPRTRYFPGGRVDVYEVWNAWDY